MNRNTLKWRLAQKIEYKWWQHYLRKKDPEQYLKWKIGYWQQVLLEISKHVPVPQNQLVLETGCGPAGIFTALQGNTVHAIDPLLDKYRNLPHFMPERSPWVQFEENIIESLTAVEKYDIIFCMNAINHVKDIELCYDNMVRALKPGGYMVISTDAHRHYLLKKLFQNIPGDVLHPVQLDINEYNTFLTKRNLQILRSILYNKENIFDYYITIARKPEQSVA